MEYPACALTRGDTFPDPQHLPDELDLPAGVGLHIDEQIIGAEIVFVPGVVDSIT
jgi:hypothetical protein